MYLALAQWDLPIPLNASINISVRSAAGSPVALAPQVITAVTAVERNVTVRSQALDVQVNDSFRQERVVALLSGSFAALALVLAGVGLYGVTGYAVARRRTEIGIRMALGAAPTGIISLVLSRVSRLVGFGVLVGVSVGVEVRRIVAVRARTARSGDAGRRRGGVGGGRRAGRLVAGVARFADRTGNSPSSRVRARLLTVDEIGKALCVTRRWVQRRARRLLFTRKDLPGRDSILGVGVEAVDAESKALGPRDHLG
jgi:hypothetical protein